MPGEPKVSFSRIRFGVRDQLGKGLHGRLRARRDDGGYFGQQSDRRKVALGVVLHVLVNELVDGARTVGGKQQCVAIRLSPCHGRAADISGSARAIFDNETSAELLGQLHGERTRQAIGGAAGGERHDDGDGTRRPAIRCRLVRSNSGQSGAAQ